MKNICKTKRYVITGFLILMLTSCKTIGSKKPEIKIEPKTLSGFLSPESVIKDPMSNNFLISNVGEKLEPTVKDGDGFISLVTPGGTIIRKYLPRSGKLNAPKGMALIGRILYVADIDRVLGFNVETWEKTFEMDFSPEKTLFLNDLAVLDENTLFVSATDIGKVYKLKLGGSPKYSVIADNIPGVNGLYFDNEEKELYVVNIGEKGRNGRLGVIKFLKHSQRYQKITDSIGSLDGITMLPNARLLISNWDETNGSGTLHIYDILTKELSLYPLADTIHGPADFFYDDDTKTLWLPMMKDGKVLIRKIVSRFDR